MANLTEQNRWEEVYQIEITDTVKGGVGGTANAQAQQLANRTAFLKEEVAKKANQSDVNTALAGKEPVIPAGVIWMWSGAVNAVPAGWAICDGNNNTPDLRGRFVVGYNPNDSDYDTVGKTGGKKTHVLGINEMPSHVHVINSAGSHTHTIHGDGSHNHSISSRTSNIGGGNGAGKQVIREYAATWEDSSTNYAGSHSHGMAGAGNHAHSMNTSGGGEAHENRPPYYVLAFIIKL